MSGSVWADLSTENMEHPKAVAAKLKDQFPNIISSAEVKIAVTVMEVTTK
jgi:hypothetical protein